MTSNIMKALGMKNKKKPDDSDEECPAYTDPVNLHATDPPSRNSRNISQPIYPPPRPCHGGNSPNPRRKNQDTTTGSGTKKPQLNDSNRNSIPGLVATEPKRAPPRINITKKLSDAEDDYCDPIDVQRKDDFIREMKTKPKDDYCEPWDSTIKTDMANMSSKKQSHSNDEHNEYLDPYDTGKEGIIEKRMSRGIGREFGAQHGKVLTSEPRRSGADIDPKRAAFDPSNVSSGDYDMPWEWKQKIQMGKMKVPKPTPQTQRPKSTSDQVSPASGSKSSAPSDDYDEPWEKKQSYLLKTQMPVTSAKSRSPVPLPRSQVQPSNPNGALYETPWDAMTQSNGQPAQANCLYETPWDATTGENASNGVPNRGSVAPRRWSQPAGPASIPGNANRKFSQPVALTDDYDTPWEYKNKQFSMMGPPKPTPLHEIANAQEVNPDLPLDQQSWYHGPLKRQEAEELLRDALDCSFLVRDSESSKSKKDFSLSMKNNENFLHLKIVRQLDGQFILGQFSKPFMDIPKVIHHYSKNKLNIRGAEHKYLKHPVSAQPEYHTIEPEDDDGIDL